MIKIQEEIPTYGNRRVTLEVQNRGFNIGRKIVKKLRDMLGFKAIYTMPKTTQRNHEQRYPKPEIFNTDQGSQYTSNEHREILKKHQIKISMDGKGRATDNIAIERFWRTIKYEDLYINEYKNVKEIKRAIGGTLNSDKKCA